MFEDTVGAVSRDSACTPSDVVRVIGRERHVRRAGLEDEGAIVQTALESPVLDGLLAVERAEDPAGGVGAGVDDDGPVELVGAKLPAVGVVAVGAVGACKT